MDICFKALAIMNNVALYSYVYAFVVDLCFHFSYVNISEAESLGYIRFSHFKKNFYFLKRKNKHCFTMLCFVFCCTAKWISLFHFLRNSATLLSKVAAPFCIPTSNMWVLLSPSLPTLGIVFFYYKHSSGVKWHLIVHFLMTNDVEYLFMCLSILIYVLWWHIQILPIKKKWVVCLFIIEM